MTDQRHSFCLEIDSSVLSVQCAASNAIDQGAINEGIHCRGAVFMLVWATFRIMFKGKFWCGT